MKTVLIVDDVPGCTEPLVALLGMSGYRAAVAGNGREALGFLGALAPDAVLLDLMMPVMDGFDFLRAIRSSQQWCHLPIVAYTALGDTATERQLSEFGVTRFLRKDQVSFDAVVSNLREIIGEPAPPENLPPGQA